MESVKIGLIGCGKQAPKHIAGMQGVPNVELIVADIDSGLADSFAKNERVSAASCVEELFDDPEVTAIDICTPTTSHFSLIKQALLNNKYVFCEKPMCASLKEATELVELETRSGRFIQVGFIYRFVPAFEHGRTMLRETLGEPFWALFRIGGRGSHKVWKHSGEYGGGAINEMLVHMLDLAEWYFGPLEDFKVISCGNKLGRRTIGGELHVVDAEDLVVIGCRGKDGVEIILQADMLTSAFTQYVEIQAEYGGFMGSIQPQMPSFVFLNEPRGNFPFGRTELKGGGSNLYKRQMGIFLEAVKTGCSPDLSTAKESLRLMEYIKKIRNEVGR